MLRLRRPCHRPLKSFCHFYIARVATRKESTQTSQNQKPRLRFHQFSLEVSQADERNKSKVLQSLKEHRLPKAVWEREWAGNAHGLVLLATPSFASWLEDSTEFLSSFVAAITHGDVAHGLKIEALVAVVDGLPPTFDGKHQSEGPMQGFSILHGPSRDLLPPSSLGDAAEHDVPFSLSTRSSITFSQKQNPRFQLTLPLANTLFKTGRPSTLMRLTFKWSSETQKFEEVEREHTNNQVISCFDENQNAMPSLTVPAIPLTPARKIVSGLGNIVRRIDFREKGIGPASKELEANVNAYLETTQNSKTTIAVWALIVPDDVLNAPSRLEATEKQPMLDFEEKPIRDAWTTSNFDQQYVGTLISKGARFCRVLSGGGGWGAKQGLLSLDPQTTYNDSHEDLPGSWSPSLQDQQAEFLGNLAQTGAYIQFFVADLDQDGSPPLAINNGNAQGETATFFGTVPETVDALLNDSSSDNMSEGQNSPVVYRPGHFGAVSESGKYLKFSSLQDEYEDELESPRTTTGTKIDMPYSFLHCKG